MRETTYGVEAEWHVGAQALIAALHAQGLAGTPELHPYHCDCDHCELRNGQPFRGQTDSSCSGEIITDILGESAYLDTAGWGVPGLLRHLCETAVEVDAEPGLTSGFHVHVSVEGVDVSTQERAVWEFLRWEPVLTRVAGGRWPDQRDGMNESARSQMETYFRDCNHDLSLSSKAMAALADEYKAATQRTLRLALLCADRHGNLNIRQGHYPTWEFRLWNSTRAAWRMELFIGLSRAFLDAGVLARLSSAPVPLRMRRPSSGFQNLGECIAAEGYDKTAEQLMRQADYLDKRAGLAPALLTTIEG